MATLLMMKGLPCSGKTEWAEAWCAQSVNRVRVSWTDLLRMMGDRQQRVRRPLAVDAALRLAGNALREGLDVVVDEENLYGPEWGLFIVRAEQVKARVRWQTMATTAEECKRRKALLGHPVADMEIDRKAEVYAEWLKKKT